MTTRTLRLALGALAALAGLRTAPAAAQEFTGFMGPQWNLSFESSTTYQWRLDYQQGLDRHWYFETGWVNDGHIPGHARDGITAQIGWRTDLWSPKWNFGIAAGPDRYYDTTNDSSNAGNFSDVQGFLLLTSAQLTYYLKNRFLIRWQVNYELAPPSTFDAWSVLVGVGYQLQRVPRGEGAVDKPIPQTTFTTGNEITGFLGQTVPNGGSSDPKGLAGMAEYRHGVWKYFDWTISYIYQGDDSVIVRNGFASQIWPARKFGPVELALGFGVFFAADEKYTPPPGQPGKGSVALLVSPTAAYRFGDHWLARFIWNRTVTTYNENTDFFGLGLGYRWGSASRLDH
jgi:hypothetical protein